MKYSVKNFGENAIQINPNFFRHKHSGLFLSKIKLICLNIHVGLIDALHFLKSWIYRVPLWRYK